MKKKLLLSFCLFTISYSLILGQNTFVKTIGGTGDEIARAAIKTIDNNFLIAGYTTSFGSGGEDGYILKVDTSGEEIWSKTIGGTSNDRLNNIIQLSNSDFLIIGWTQSFGSGGKLSLIHI